MILITVYNKSDSPQYHSVPSSLLSQAMVITEGSSLGTLTSLTAVRQVTESRGSGSFKGYLFLLNWMRYLSTVSEVPTVNDSQDIPSLEKLKEDIAWKLKQCSSVEGGSSKIKAHLNK